MPGGMPTGSPGPPGPSLLPMPDMKARDMVLFFLFGLFAFQFELYLKLSEFDFSSDLNTSIKLKRSQTLLKKDKK